MKRTSRKDSYGYRPKRHAHEAISKVSRAVIEGKSKVIDVDLKNCFDGVRHHILMAKIAKRINDKDIMALLKKILKAGGKRGIGQGSPLSPLLSNIYLNEVDKRLEKAREVTKKEKYMSIEYVRFADDMVILIDGHKRWEGLERRVYRGLQEELEKLEVGLNEEKTKIVDLRKKHSFSFLGFDFQKTTTMKGKNGLKITPKIQSRTLLFGKLKEVFRGYKSQPIGRMISIINPILRGWINYFRIGHSSRCFGYVRRWVEKKVRRNLMKARGRQGFGWKRWSSQWIYKRLGLYEDYTIRYYEAKVLPVQ